MTESLVARLNKGLSIAIVLVGDELVRGGIPDENRDYLSGELDRHGVRTRSIHVVRDDAPFLAHLLRHITPTVTYVLTVGGLGPTVDDVTLSAVAQSFNLSIVERSPNDAADFARMSGSETLRPSLRRVPTGSEIIETEHGPVVRTKNVFSLPGLPRLVRARFPAVLTRIGKSDAAPYLVAWSVPLPQSAIARILEDAAGRHNEISIGCYPDRDAAGNTSISIEGWDEQAVKACEMYIRKHLPGDQRD